MRFPIDAVFLDRRTACSGSRPSCLRGEWRPASSARAVLELPAGEAQRRGLKPGVSLTQVWRTRRELSRRIRQAPPRLARAERLWPSAGCGMRGGERPGHRAGGGRRRRRARLVSELLTRAGYQVSEAPNGRDALKSLFEERPDLVLLDISMPELDGWATLDRIRELSDVPVVMLSARRRRAREGARVAGRRGRLRDQAVRAPGAARARRSVLRRAPAPEVRATPIATVCSRSTSRSAACGPVTQPVELTPLEYRLLTAFVDHPGQLLAHEQLLELAWGGERGPRATRSSSTSATCAASWLRRASRPTRSKPCVGRLPVLAGLSCSSASIRTPQILRAERLAHGDYRFCSWIRLPRARLPLRARTENFPVASLLFPRALRPHLRAIYGFARLVDMLGDEVPRRSARGARRARARSSRRVTTASRRGR